MSTKQEFKKGDMFMTVSGESITVENAGLSRMIAHDKNNKIRVYLVETGELMKDYGMDLKNAKGWDIEYQMTRETHPEYFI